jgi:hypothetical protein
MVAHAPVQQVIHAATAATLALITGTIDMNSSRIKKGCVAIDLRRTRYKEY